jgi:glutamate N-acetyltransferase/amino-acid N-acetyltransferase
MSDIALPSCFRFAGIVSGLRSEPNRRDLGVIVSDTPCAAAGVFTQNRVSAAPVQVSKSRLPRSDARAVVVCSGNANACTGEQGLKDARRMAELTAAGVGCEAEQVLVASTGVIGRPLPMAILEAGIPKAVAEANAASLDDFAHSILTTDTKIKISHRKVGSHTVLGIAKGAAMIGPNMATMLGFLLTDARLPAEELQLALRTAVNKSFNRIAVEGHTSTNDCVIALANGTNRLNDRDRAQVMGTFETVCRELSRQIIEDAEGANHVIEIRVTGCRTGSEAEAIARTVASSALVKTAVFGHDPNWGRVVSAAGYAGVMFEEKDLSLTMGETLLYKDGTPLVFDAKAASAYLKDNRHVTFHLVFKLGDGECTFHTSDLTYDYVKLNADYTT